MHASVNMQARVDVMLAGVNMQARSTIVLKAARVEFMLETFLIQFHVPNMLLNMLQSPHAATLARGLLLLLLAGASSTAARGRRRW